MTVHSVGSPALEQRRTRVGRLKMFLVLLVCAAPVIASYFTYFVIRPQARTNYGELIQPTRSLPPQTWTTLQGQAVQAPSLKGQWLLVAIGPSSCDAACEQRLYTQRQLREMLGREADRLDRVWLLTDDGQPAPTLVTALSATKGLTMLRADPAALAQWLAPAAGQALEAHLYVVDPMGEWMMRLPPQPEPAKVKRDLDKLMRASSSWDQAGR
ncbi:MAG: SCO family protein [Rubrivivax sp.]|jgi:hypothetical protein